MRTHPANEWRETPHGEWICDGVGILARRHEAGWFAYLLADGLTLGPFPTLDEAKRAIVSAHRLAAVYS